MNVTVRVKARTHMTRPGPEDGCASALVRVDDLRTALVRWTPAFLSRLDMSNVFDQVVPPTGIILQYMNIGGSKLPLSLFGRHHDLSVLR